MATYSTNLNLELQAPGERARLTVLNANLGKIDDFAGDAKKLTNIQAYSLDCNDIDENCTVYVTDDATHSPGAWYIMTTCVFASNAICQYAISVTNSSMKMRQKSTSWGDWKELAIKSTWETVTPTIDSTKVGSGVVSCVKRDGWAYVQIYSMGFLSSGNLTGVVTGLPQAIVGGDGTFIGTSASASAEISASGDTWYIDSNTGSLNVILGSTYPYGHWTSFMYPCV